MPVTIPGLSSWDGSRSATPQSEFMESNTLEERSGESMRIRKKFPDRAPVICEKDPRSDIMDIDKSKFLVPLDISLGHFVYVIRKRINVEPSKSVFLFINNTIPPTAASMSSIYEQYKNEDGFLYVTYSGENTFG
uniref:Autophagy-related protein n=1 Tax=Aplanochytrium stocchinoi TaxID=215587 RepID=A0A7S3PN80_9STRA|mmetsp:Transcript_4930/g.6229  ORF Transcript_4930/g.6229 Transcript_4930/m.6229 type:complete len:135 (+) Transcript_4930:37-441(+)